jgi:hypothetical protein
MIADLNATNCLRIYADLQWMKQNSFRIDVPFGLSVVSGINAMFTLAPAFNGEKRKQFNLNLMMAAY